MAKNVWALVHGKVQKYKVHALDVFVLVRSLLEKLTEKVMEHWAITSWAIWNAGKTGTSKTLKCTPWLFFVGQLLYLMNIRRW